MNGREYEPLDYAVFSTLVIAGIILLFVVGCAAIAIALYGADFIVNV